MRIKEDDAWAQKLDAADRHRMPTLEPQSVLHSAFPGPTSLFQVPAHTRPGTCGQARCLPSGPIAQGQSSAGREGEAELPVTSSALEGHPVTKQSARQGRRHEAPGAGSLGRGPGLPHQPRSRQEQVRTRPPGSTRSLGGRARPTPHPGGRHPGRGVPCLGITLASSRRPTVHASGRGRQSCRLQGSPCATPHAISEGKRFTDRKARATRYLLPGLQRPGPKCPGGTGAHPGSQPPSITRQPGLKASSLRSGFGNGAPSAGPSRSH